MQSDDTNDDYDNPLTPEEEAVSDSAWQAYLRGGPEHAKDLGESLDAVREALLGRRAVQAAPTDVRR
jgi:hypothetical protein